MICPKCDEGKLVKIIFKNSLKMGYLCNFCLKLWLEGEQVVLDTSKTLQTYCSAEGSEYSFSELSEKGQEYESVYYVEYK